MGMTFKDQFISPNGKYFAGIEVESPDIRYGGQFGYMPRIGISKNGKNYGEFITNEPYVAQNIIPLLLTTPRFMDVMPNGVWMKQALKNLMETMAYEINGLSSGLEVDSDETPIGGAGEVYSVPVNVTRSRSVLSFVWKEQALRPIQNFWNMYIRYGIMDPDTKSCLSSTFFSSATTADGNTFNGVYSSDYWSFTMLFIKPDITHTVVDDAWLCTNMYPNKDGERTGKRSLMSPKEGLDLDVEFTPITLNNYAVKLYAEEVLKGLTVFNNLPDFTIELPVTEVAPVLRSSASQGWGFSPSGKNADNAPTGGKWGNTPQAQETQIEQATVGLNKKAMPQG